MMHLNGKFVNLSQLRDEARAAGVLPANGELGTFGDYLFTYDASGQPADLDAVKVQPIINAHAPVRPLMDSEIYQQYGAANNAGDAKRMAHLVAMAQGLVPRETVPMEAPSVTPLPPVTP